MIIEVIWPSTVKKLNKCPGGGVGTPMSNRKRDNSEFKKM